jgi:hypothetical protein
MCWSQNTWCPRLAANVTRCVHPWCGKGGGEPDGEQRTECPIKPNSFLCVPVCVCVCVYVCGGGLNICFIYDVPKLCNTESHIKSFWTSLLLFPERTVSWVLLAPALHSKVMRSNLITRPSWSLQGDTHLRCKGTLALMDMSCMSVGLQACMHVSKHISPYVCMHVCMHGTHLHMHPFTTEYQYLILCSFFLSPSLYLGPSCLLS